VPYIAVEEVRYNDRLPWPVAADGDGSSLHRRLPGAFGNDPTNWFAGNPTPGQIELVNPDSDGDGLPDAWELANGTQVGVSDGEADLDHDGMTNFQEFRAGTSPTNAASALRLEISLSQLGQPVITFTQVAGVGYDLQYRTNLQTGAWEQLTNLTAGTITTVFNVTDAAVGTGSRFYRLVVP
jgi:hypothetical protein